MSHVLKGLEKYAALLQQKFSANEIMLLGSKIHRLFGEITATSENRIKLGGFSDQIVQIWKVDKLENQGRIYI